MLFEILTKRQQAKRQSSQPVLVVTNVEMTLYTCWKQTACYNLETLFWSVHVFYVHRCLWKSGRTPDTCNVTRNLPSNGINALHLCYVRQDMTTPTDDLTRDNSPLGSQSLRGAVQCLPRIRYPHSCSATLGRRFRVSISFADLVPIWVFSSVLSNSVCSAILNPRFRVPHSVVDLAPTRVFFRRVRFHNKCAFFGFGYFGDFLSVDSDHLCPCCRVGRHFSCLCSVVFPRSSSPVSSTVRFRSARPSVSRVVAR